MEYSIVLRSRAFRYHIKFILLLNINSVMFIIFNNTTLIIFGLDILLYYVVLKNTENSFEHLVSFI